MLHAQAHVYKRATTMKFKSLDAYLAAFRKGEADAILPIDDAADHFGVTSKTISSRLKRGTLKKVTIGKDNHASLQGVLQIQDEDLEKVGKIEKYLKKAIDQGSESIFYNEIMKLVGLKLDNPHHRSVIGDLLGKVSRRSHTKNKTLLSVMVHNKKTGKTIPNDSFFMLADELGYPISDKSKRGDKVKWSQKHTKKIIKLRDQT
jgi:hypothetical protein